MLDKYRAPIPFFSYFIAGSIRDQPSQGLTTLSNRDGRDQLKTLSQIESEGYVVPTILYSAPPIFFRSFDPITREVYRISNDVGTVFDQWVPVKEAIDLRSENFPSAARKDPKLRESFFEDVRDSYDRALDGAFYGIRTVLAECEAFRQDPLLKDQLFLTPEGPSSKMRDRLEFPLQNGRKVEDLIFEVAENSTRSKKEKIFEIGKILRTHPEFNSAYLRDLEINEISISLLKIIENLGSQRFTTDQTPLIHRNLDLKTSEGRFRFVRDILIDNALLLASAREKLHVQNELRNSRLLDTAVSIGSKDFLPESLSNVITHLGFDAKRGFVDIEVKMKSDSFGERNIARAFLDTYLTTMQNSFRKHGRADLEKAVHLLDGWVKALQRSQNPRLILSFDPIIWNLIALRLDGLLNSKEFLRGKIDRLQSQQLQTAISPFFPSQGIIIFEQNWLSSAVRTDARNTNKAKVFEFRRLFSNKNIDPLDILKEIAADKNLNLSSRNFSPEVDFKFSGTIYLFLKALEGVSEDSVIWIRSFTPFHDQLFRQMGLKEASNSDSEAKFSNEREVTEDWEGAISSKILSSTAKNFRENLVKLARSKKVL